MCVNFGIDPFRGFLHCMFWFFTRVQQNCTTANKFRLIYLLWVNYYFIKHKKENTTSEFPSDFFS